MSMPCYLGFRQLAGRGLRHVAVWCGRWPGRSLRRVSANWEAAYGHPLELAETFVDPWRFHGGGFAKHLSQEELQPRHR